MKLTHLLTSIPFRVFSSLQNNNLKEWLWPREKERERQTFFIFNQPILFDLSVFKFIIVCSVFVLEKSQRIQLLYPSLPKFLFRRWDLQPISKDLYFHWKRLDYFPDLVSVSVVEVPFIDLSLSTKSNRLSLTLRHFDSWVCVDFLKELQVVERDGV